jgi:PKD repeat protein
MEGIIAQSISTSILNIENITINNASGVNLESGSMNLSGTMTLTNGAFNTNNALTIISNASGTGRIAEITGGSIAGNITMQRYIDAGATNWRFISSAVSNPAITQLNDDFETSGYPGSLFPNWPTAANPWPSVYYYDETVAGAQDNGYTAPTSGTNTIGTGEGLWVWCGDTITGTQPFTLDLTGAANTGNINLPVTYTNTGMPTDDGWNMVGNPYPSTLDWDSPSITKSNINNAIYIWNPDLEQFASYVGGFGTNGGSRYIASTQAFWVQANAASPLIQVTEASKSNTDATFLKTSNTLPLVFNIQNNYGTDEMIINLNNDATLLFDPLYDAEKLASTNANLPYICSVINSNTDLSINQVPAQETIIPIKVKSGTSGLHTISIDNISEYDYLNCIFLEDVFTGTTYNLFNQQSFMVFISDTTTSARFLLHIGTSNTLSSIDPSCMEINDGLIVIENNSTTGFETTLTDSEGNILVNNTGVYNTDSIFNLASGTYTIQTNDATCGNISEIVILNEPSLITANFTYTNTALTYTFNNTSQNGISYLWDFGDGSTSTLENPDYTYLSEGTYLVTLTVYQNETCFATTTQWVTIISTGIETVNEVEAKVWINDNALLINTSTEQYETYQIKNTLGQILVSESFHNNNKASCNLNSISSQVLFITLINPNKSKTIKVVYNK